MNELLALRLELDRTITYGSSKAALKLARTGVRKASEAKVDGEIEYFRGQVALLRHQWATAIEHFDKAISYNPHDGAAYNDRALCMVELGILDEALWYFDKGIEVEPGYATIYHNKGWLLNHTGQYTQALVCFRKALELEKDRAVTYDNMADALFNIGDYSGALLAYKKVLALLEPGTCKAIRAQIRRRIKSIEKQVSGHTA